MDPARHRGDAHPPQQPAQAGFGVPQVRGRCAAGALGPSRAGVAGEQPWGVPAAGSPLLLGTNHRNGGTRYFHCCVEKVNYFQAGIKLTPPEVYII